MDRQSNKTAPSGLTKVFFNLDASDWHGKNSESMWAEAISPGKYKIQNSPFFAKGVSFEDIILTEKRGDKNYYVGTAISGGHSTYRIILQKNAGEQDFRKFWLPLQKIGCSFESARIDFLMYAVDIPPEANIYNAFELLSAGENAGIWEFEEGHCGHLL